MSNAINCDSLMYWIPGFNFQKQFTTTCGYTMNYFVRLTINQLCNSRISESYVCFIFLKHSVKEMTIKCVMIGINIIIAEKFSLEVKCFSISSLTSSQFRRLSFVILQYIRINQLLSCLVIPSLLYVYRCNDLQRVYFNNDI